MSISLNKTTKSAHRPTESKNVQTCRNSTYHWLSHSPLEFLKVQEGQRAPSTPTSNAHSPSALSSHGSFDTVLVEQCSSLRSPGSVATYIYARLGDSVDGACTVPVRIARAFVFREGTGEQGQEGDGGEELHCRLLLMVVVVVVVVESVFGWWDSLDVRMLKKGRELECERVPRCRDRGCWEKDESEVRTTRGFI